MPELPKLAPVAGRPVSLVLLPGTYLGDPLPVLRGWAEEFRDREAGSEILFVSSGQLPPDADVPGLRHLQFAEGGGVGDALRVGLPACSCPLVAVAPLHPSYPPHFLRAFLAEIDKVHLLTGFRAGLPVPLPFRLVGLAVRSLCWVAFSHWPRALPGWPGWRGRRLAWLARYLFGVRAHDVLCPFRLMRREVLERCPIQSNTELAFLEQLAKINFLGYLFGEEVPLPVSPLVPVLAPAKPADLRRDLRRLVGAPDFGPAALPARL